jgi:rhodanese-like protein
MWLATLIRVTPAGNSPYREPTPRNPVQQDVKTKMIFFFSLLAGLALYAAEAPIPNPLIDYRAYLKIAQNVEATRAQRRLTEDQFLAMSREPGTLILDARSESKFKLRHIEGAINLPFTDFTAASLAKAIPEKRTRLLIYCNNNFLGSPAAFASKLPAASLNISTYVALATYGYTNVYELGPLIDLKRSKLPFAGEEVSPPK